MRDTQKAALLRRAIDLLALADAFVQDALGDTDSCYNTHCGIEELIEDLRADIMELENVE